MDYVALTPRRAAAGARLLDVEVPEWPRLLVRPLSMASTRNCVLAQLFERFRMGAAALKLNEAGTLGLGFRACSSELGNNIRAFKPYYDALTAAWERERQMRLAA